MILTPRSSCWVTPDGRALRFFQAGECYRVSTGFGRDLLRRGLATIPTHGEFMTHYPPRLLTLVTPPQYEPLTLAETKLFLRVDGNEEDSLILSLISAAREKVEIWLRRSLLTQVWQLQQVYVPGQNIRLALGPVQSVDSVNVTRLGTVTALTADQYSYAPESQELAVEAGMDADRVSVTYTCGYTDATRVPAAIRQGLLHAIAHDYHHREEGGDLPAETRRMLSDYREMRV